MHDSVCTGRYLPPSRHVLTDNPQSGEYVLNINDGLTVHDNNHLHILHILHFPLDFAGACARKLLLAVSAADVKRILDVHFHWRDLPIDDVVKVS